MNEDLTKSGHVGVRWQAQMEAHLEASRLMIDSATDALKGGGSREAAAVWAALAGVNAQAAQALAIVNGLGDIESALNDVAKAIQES